MNKAKIGIMSLEQYKNHTIAIAKGEYKPNKNEPKIWFTSMKSLANVLLEENQLLLKLILENEPKSVSGLEFVGKIVLVDQIEEGTWIIKCGEFIPDSEKWLYTDDNMSKIDKALDWADKNKPSSNFDALIQRIENDFNNYNDIFCLNADGSS